MVSNKQISKTHNSKKVLTEQLQNSDRLDITDLLKLERDTIDNILREIQEIPFDISTANYIYSLVQTSDMLLNNVCTEFLEIDCY